VKLSAQLKKRFRGAGDKNEDSVGRGYQHEARFKSEFCKLFKLLYSGPNGKLNGNADVE
jgi:hypothetical protein